MKMKKSLSVILSVIAILLASCNNWMKDDNLYSDIENDVKVANASKINVYVRYAMTKQGKTDPDGAAIFKVEIPHEISATTETEYGFVRWAAFTTDFLATGDNQNKNKDFLFVDEEDYNTRFLPSEIQAPTVVFEDPYSPTTKVTINQKRDDLFLVPIVTQRPAVALTIPARGSGGVVRNMSVRINFTKPMDEESFKNSEGVFDTITITQGTQTFTSEGDIEIDSEDITSRFQAPVFSKNKKMITLQFKESEVEEGYASQSSVTITISKEVKDLYGFTMVDDEKISFTVGSNKDTLAPRITSLTGGVGGDFAKFQGVYQDSVYKAATVTSPAIGVIEHIGQTNTKMKYEGAENAPKNNVEADFFGGYNSGKPYNFYANRVGEKIIIRVYAEDIAGSGQDQSPDGIETDVSKIGIRAKLLYNINGEPSTQSLGVTSYSYMPQINQTSLQGLYKDLVEASYVNSPVVLDSTKGTLLEYDLSGLDDGLIQIDVAAVDIILNSGFTAGGAFSSEYGNGYASLFVVKDTTAPKPLAAGKVEMSINNSAIDQTKYYNATDYEDIELAVKEAVVDQGHARLRSSDVYWIVKPSEFAISATESGWKKAIPNQKFGSLTRPSSDRVQSFVYAFRDDLGNIQEATLPETIKYDGTNPRIDTIKWVVEAGATEGITKGNVLSAQTLEIPITEETSGLNQLQVSIKLNGSAYQSPFSASGLEIKANNGQTITYSVNNNILTFAANPTNVTSITIKGLKLAESTTEGNYDISVKATDAAGNYFDTSTQQILKLYNDSTAPEEIKVFVPDVKKVLPINATSSSQPSYWINATGLGNINSPKTDIYVTFKENGSGPKIFDFSGSTFTLTEDSKIYKVDNIINKIPQGPAIERKRDGNVLSINSKDDAAQLTGDSVTVKITDVALNVSNTTTGKTSSSVKLKISDVATNIPNTFVETMESKDAKCGDLTDIASIEYDRIAIPQFGDQSVIDRKADKSITYKNSDNQNQTINISAVDKYTNEQYVDGQLKLNSNSNSVTSVYAITISGSAEFEIEPNVDAKNKTKVYDSDNNEITDVIITRDTITFWDSTNHCYKAVDSAKIIKIKNIKLTNPETNNKGLNTVHFTIKSVCERNSANAAFSQIFLDTTPPAWNTSNSGLYIMQTNEEFYPRSAQDTDSTYGLVNRVSGNTANDVYFYTSAPYANLNIFADVIESGSGIPDSYIYFTNNTGSINSDSGSKNFAAAYSYLQIVANNGDNTFTTRVIDKAGNVSEPKTFHIVKPVSVNSGADALEHSGELIVPTGCNPGKNTHLNEVRAYMPYNYSDHSSSYDPNKSDYVYYTNPISETIDQLYVYNYVLKKFSGNYKLKVKLSDYASATSSYAPIEKYGISHRYTTFSSSGSGCQNDGFTPEEVELKSYIDANGNYSTETETFDSVTSSIDSNGDIIITLPDHDCPPLALWVQDGCGNKKAIQLNPGLKNKIGENNLHVSGGSRVEVVGWVVDDKLSDTISSVQFHYGVDDAHFKFTNGDTYYFKGGAYVYQTNNEECLFSSDDTSDDEYSLRALLYAGEEPSDDVINNFADSAWTNKKYTSRTQTDNTLSLDLPHNITTASTKLWYVVEDRIGNRKVIQVKDGNVTQWQYDDIPPSMEVVENSAENINTFGNKNYWSDSSTVTYRIIDSGSGIKNDGINEYTTYLSSVNKSQTNIKDFFTTQPSYGLVKSITISGVVDQIGNSAAEESLKIKTGEDQSGNPVYADKWVKLGTPTLSGITTSLTPVKFATDNNVVASDLNLSGSGNAYTLKPKSKVSKIKISLTDEDSFIMGYLVSSTELSSFNAFYTQSQVETEYIIQKKNQNSNDVNDEETAWIPTTLYLYPVNKAGLACASPITIELKDNPVPSLVNGGTGTYPTYNITSSVGIETAGYLNPSSTINFTSSIEISEFWIIDNERKGQKIQTYQTSGTTHTITFDDTSKWSGKTGRKLYLQLSTGTQDSLIYKLIMDNNSSTTWTYDETAPEFSVSVNQAQQKTGSTTWYVTSETPTVTFTPAANTTDIKKYQLKDSNGEFVTFTTSTTLTGISETEVKTFVFRAVDMAGNISDEASVSIKRDATGPSGAISITPQKQTGENTYSNASAATASASGDYIFDNGKLSYRSDVVKRLYITQSTTIADSGIGLNNQYLYYRESGSQTAEAVTDNNSILISSLDTSKTYEIIAKDKLGNITVLISSLTLSPFSSGPSVSTPKTVPYTNLAGDVKYQNAKIVGVAEQEGYSMTPSPANADDNKILDTTPGQETYVIRAIWQNTTFALPISSTLPSNYIYFKLQFISKEDQLTADQLNLSAPTSGWTRTTKAAVTSGTTTNSTTEPCVVVHPTDVADAHSFIFVWLKDELGNISVYNLPNPANDGQNWWTADSTGPSGSVGYTVKNGDNNATENVNFTKTESGNTVTITYNHSLNTVKSILLDTSNVQDKCDNTILGGVGLAGLYYTENEETTLVPFSGNTITLDGEYKTYKIYAKDKLGNVSGVLKTFVFVEDSTAPTCGNITVSPNYKDSNVTKGYIKNGNTITYSSNFVSGITLSAESLETGAKLVYSLHNGANTDYNNSISLPETNGTVTTCVIKAVDKVGNSTDLLTLTLTNDNTAPNPQAGSTMNILDENGDAVTDTTRYTISGLSVTYHPDYVKKVQLLPGGMGEGEFLIYKIGETEMNYSASLTSSYNNTSCDVYAEDALGNRTDKLWTMTLTADSTLGESQGGGNGGNGNRFSTTFTPGSFDTSAIAGSRDLAATQISSIDRGIIMNKDLDAAYATADTSTGATSTAKAVKSAKKAAKKAAKQAKTAKKATQTVEQAAAVVSAPLEVTELPAETLAAPAPEDAVAMLLPQTANTKQVEPQASVPATLVDTAATTTADEAPQDNLVLKLIIALAALVICVASGLTWFLKKSFKR